MNTKEILNKIEKVDQKIMDIYDLIKKKEVYNESYENEKYDLNNLVIAENYLYSKLNIKDLNKIFNIYANKISELSYEKLIDCLKLNYNNKKDIIQKLIYIRIYNKLYDLCNIKKSNDEKYVDELTDIYVPENITKYMDLNKTNYIKSAMTKKEKVFAFKEEVKKELLNKVDLDISIIRIIILEISLEQTAYDKFYLEEIYGQIFIDKNLEEKILLCDFDTDKLFEEIYLKKEPKTSNQKFYYWYRSHKAFAILENLLEVYLKFKEDYFLPDNPYNIINQTKYKIYLLTLNAYMMLLNKEDYEQFKSDGIDYVKYIKNEYGMNQLADILSANINEKNYQKLKKIMDL